MQKERECTNDTHAGYTNDIQACMQNIQMRNTRLKKIEPLIDQMIKLCDLLKHIKTLIKNPTNSDKQQEIGIKTINTNLSCIFDLTDLLEQSTAEMFTQIVTMFNKIEFIKK